MQRYWDMYKDELDEDDAYQSIKRGFYPEDEDYYQRGGGRGNSSSNNQRGGSNSSSSYHSDPEGKLKELAKAYEKIQNFFLALGLDYKAYLEPIQPRRR